MHRRVELSINNRSEYIILPVTPAEIAVSMGQMNQTLNLLNVGEINLLGNRGLATLTLASFFPAPESHFYRHADREPWEYVDTLDRWRKNKEVARIIVSHSQINMAVAIERITPAVREGDRDVSYTLELREYRLLNVSAVQEVAAPRINGLNDRPDTSRRPRYHIVLSDEDSFWFMAAKYYGDGGRWREIAEANGSPATLPIGTKVVIP